MTVRADTGSARPRGKTVVTRRALRATPMSAPTRRMMMMMTKIMFERFLKLGT